VSSQSLKYPIIFTKLIFYHYPSCEGELSIIKISNNIHKINILSQSVLRRRALNYENIQQYSQKLIFYHNPSYKGELSIMEISNNIHNINILPQFVPRRRALNHEKYPTIQNWYLIKIHPTKASSQLWKNPTIQNWYLITIRPAKASSESWKISNNIKLISYHNPSSKGELLIMKNIQQYYQNTSTL